LRRRVRRRAAGLRGRALKPPARIAATLAAATLAGLLAAALRVPLPWTIGPLLSTAALSLAGAPVLASDRLRNLGQWAIGVALGLYFTPAVVAQTVALAPAIAVGVAWAFVLAWAFHRWLAWTHPGESAATTWFAAAIGGASEMAALGERAGARVDRVAAAHSLRVLLVVVGVPVALQLAGAHGADAAAPALREVRPAGLLLLAALTGAAIAVFARLALPNPFVLGALAVTAALSGAGHPLSALPREATNAGQLFIGVALGVRFRPEFLRAAPRWLAAVAVGTLGMMALSAGFAVVLARAAGLHPASTVLATSPGGIAEMAITAKVLGLGVPVVTAFHVVRYVAVLLGTAPLFRRFVAPSGPGTARAG
jgi:membrane AbrB-like protein